MPSYKTPQVNFVCSKQEYAEIEKKAKAANMKVATYCRFVSLNAKIKVEVKVKGERE